MNPRTLIVPLAALAIAGCGDDGDTSSTANGNTASAADAAERPEPKVEVPKGAPPKGLEVKDLIKGSGPAAAPGDVVTVQYVGVDYDTEKQFDASWDHGQPFTFQLGGGQVIAGWDKGLDGMRVGGQRELIIPPDLAYGRIGQPPAIGPDATLVFVIDLLGIQ